jgi:hypothetical protein
MEAFTSEAPQPQPAAAAEGPPGRVPVTIWLELATFAALVSDARQDGVSIATFIANHLRKCAAAGGHSV